MTIIMTDLALKKQLWTTTVVMVLLKATRCSMVVAQLATCRFATALARNSMFEGEFKTCPNSCYETTQCEKKCIYDASGAVVAGCTDGCVYESLAGYKVGR
jgi:predicted choloylglycine hydrolase